MATRKRQDLCCRARPQRTSRPRTALATIAQGRRLHLAVAAGKAQVFNVEGHPTVKEVEFHPGGGTHGDSPYYKLVSTEKMGNKNIEIRVIDPSPDFSPGTITRYQQYYNTQGNRLKYEGGVWKHWK